MRLGPPRPERVPRPVRVLVAHREHARGLVRRLGHADDDGAHSWSPACGPGSCQDRMVFVVVGVTGGIAAYKTVHLVRLLVKGGHDVHVVPTADAVRFVGLPTWESISRNPVTTSVHDDVARVRHVALGQAADLVIVAPATANTLAKMATGLADDLLGTTLLATTAPVVVAPAMHTEMWRHPATTANIATLRARGVVIVGPADGELTGGDSGPGRMSEPEEILDAGAGRGRARQHRRPRRAPGRRQRRRHPRADRPGALHRQPLQRQAGDRGRPGRGRPRRRRRARRRPCRRGSAGRGIRSPARDGRARRDRRRACRPRWARPRAPRRDRHGGGRRGLPRRGGLGVEADEGCRSRPRASPSISSRTTTSSRASCAAATRRPDRRRLRRRDPGRGGEPARARATQGCAQGRRTSSP